MGRHMLAGNPPIEVELKRSPRARRMTLRVSRLDGRVTLTMPPRLAEKEGLAFLKDRESWLRTHLAGVGGALPMVFGTAIPLEGAEVLLTAGAVRRPTREGSVLLLPPDPDKVAARTLAYLKAAARDRLAVACDRHAAALGRTYGRLTLRDTRSRWGSCSSRGDLMFSWRLIMAPSEILDYVAAHEVAHLAEMNHSDAFWAVCGRLYPDYKTARRWLRNNGSELHRLRFAP